MTDYIEQMMKTAGVKKCENFRQYNYARVPEGKEELKKSQNNGIECIRIRNCPDKNNTCIYWTELFYPDFTAEKQLELIKLIGATYVYFYYYSERGKHDFTVELVDNRTIHGRCNDFTQALAQLTIELTNAGELDKEKVKEILEG